MFRNSFMISMVAVVGSLVLGGCAAGVTDDVPSSTATQGITGIEEGIDLRAKETGIDNALNPSRVTRVTPANVEKDMKLKSQRPHFAHPGYEVLGPQFAPANGDINVTPVAPQFVEPANLDNDDPAGQL